MQQSPLRAREASASRTLVALLLAASALPIMQSGLLAPALPVIGDHFHDTADVTLLVRVMLVAPTLTVVLFAPLVGALADRIGAKPLLTAGLALYGLCGVAALSADGLEQLIVVRLVLGFAVCAISAITAILVGTYFAGARRDRMLGWQAALIGLSGAAFPAAGGLLASLGWRYVFLPYLFAFFLLFARPPLSATPPAAVPRAAAPFPYASVLVVYLLAFAGTLVLYLLPTQLAFHMREHGNPAPSIAGFALATASLGAAAASLVYPRLRKKLPFVRIAAASFCLVALGYSMIAVATAPSVFAVGLAVSGFGFGLNLPNCAAWLLNRVPESTRGTTSGGLATSMFLGQFVSPFVYDPLVGHQGSSGAFLAVAGASLAVAAVLASRLPGSRSGAPAAQPAGG